MVRTTVKHDESNNTTTLDTCLLVVILEKAFYEVYENIFRQYGNCTFGDFYDTIDYGINEWPADLLQDAYDMIRMDFADNLKYGGE